MHQSRDVSAAVTIARKGELGIIADGLVARVAPIAHQKSGVKTKVFERLKLSVGDEKREVA
ncbi:hypothetical protein [Opacimonas viscosa]|uniref:Uncharacterized protein n=1 Tax=Opacimonas viscosa TaxID=2961944 RepID=A0AA41X2S5_9ALTE|nr:hypothetical protein [Opacimonas viscosa]MCP3427559.1 hypothetical protein [Opacimonas viscosa]